MKMRKLIAALMALMLCFGMAVGSLADTYDIPIEDYELLKQNAIDALVEELLMTESRAAFNDLWNGFAESQQNAIFEHLTDEQIAAVKAHRRELAKAEYVPVPAVNFTQAGPFMPAVNVAVTKKLMKAPLKSAPQTSAPADAEGLETVKTVEDNGDGTYTITLETWTTGSIQDVSTSSPVDIVLVLDQSTSMNESFTGSTSRQAALKSSVNNFISSVAAQYSSEADNRIAIVTFYDSAYTTASWTYVDASGAASLKNAVNNLPVTIPDNQGTETCEGIEAAETLMGSGYSYTGSNKERQKVVILFTDGVPTSQEYWGNWFDADTAKKAIASANRLKNNNATVYSVGIQDGANPDQYDLTLNEWYGEEEGEEGQPILANRFLNYVSSNFNGISDIGGYQEDNGSWFWTDYQFKATANYTRSNTGYYLTANNATALNNIFQSISSQITVPTISLGTDTKMKDTVTQYFTIDETSIATYTAAFNGTSFGDPTSLSGLTASVSNGTLSVNGFNFDANVCTSAGGNKLIVTFKVKPKDGFLGGNQVPTNDQSGSGVYPPDADSPIENYVPDYPNDGDGVDVNLKELKVRIPEVNVYENGDYEELIAPKLEVSTDGGTTYVSFDTWKNSLEDWQKDYVKDITPVYDKETGKVSVTLDPSVTGSKESKTFLADVTLNVYVPVLTFTDDTVEFDATVDKTYMDANNYLTAKTVWKCGDKKDTEVNMTGTKSTITVTYDPSAPTLPKAGGDIPVKVTIKTNDEMSAATFLWEKDTDCPDTCTAAPENAQFRIHVKPGISDLTITKSGLKDGDSAIINANVVTPDGNKTYTFTLTGNGSSVTIKDVIIGSDYTVTEDMEWSWRYTNSTPTKTGTIKANANENVVTFTNVYDGGNWLDDETTVKNVFDAVGGDN